MTVYGGFDPGTFQAWALNLFSSVFVKAGIARGFQVTPTSPVGMSVQATLDSTYQDGVVYLPNGAFLRIDAVTVFTISANSTGQTRTDALVAQVDPTNSANLSLAVQANWTTNFAAASDQLVIALISVASGASSITSGNITMNSSIASVGGAGGSNSLIANDGMTMVAMDSSASSTFTLALSNLSPGVARAVVVQSTDASALGHTFTFATDSTFLAPGGLRSPNLYFDPTSINGETPNAVTLLTMSSPGGLGFIDSRYYNPTQGWFYFMMKNGTEHVDDTGAFSRALLALNASSAYSVNGHDYSVGPTLPASPHKFDVAILTSFS